VQRRRICLFASETQTDSDPAALQPWDLCQAAPWLIVPFVN
jgi:hypothetical protein